MPLNYRGQGIPVIHSYAELLPHLQKWRTTLNRLARSVPPPPPPFNFAATSARGGIVLTWAKVQSITTGKTGLGRGTNPYGVDGYEILVSKSGDFVTDLIVVQITHADQLTYTLPVPSAPVTYHFKIHSTAGTDANPHSVIGPDTAMIQAASLDPNDTTTVPTTTRDTTTSDFLRATARFGRYGQIVRTE